MNVKRSEGIIRVAVGGDFGASMSPGTTYIVLLPVTAYYGVPRCALKVGATGRKSVRMHFGMRVVGMLVEKDGLQC